MAASPVPGSRLQFSFEKTPQKVTVRASGKIILETSEILEKTVAELVSGTKHVVLDMSDVNYVDSSGLGALINIFMAADKASCKLELASVKPRIAELFKMTKLDEVFAGRAAIPR